MRRLWDDIDIHVVVMLLMLAPAMFLGWWGLAALLLVPQGRIGTRVLVDYPAFQRKPLTYLVANELLVLTFGSVALWAWLAFGATA